MRDRFLFALLFGTGMRIGQALGLRHEDVVSHERRIELVPREDNANGARGKRETLPNGYCGLPLQQSCPHPNACLTCDSFLTTEEFLPLHRDQLERTELLLAEAERNGNGRLVEMNTPVKLNLARIIEGLEALDPHEDKEADAA